MVKVIKFIATGSSQGARLRLGDPPKSLQELGQRRWQLDQAVTVLSACRSQRY